MLEITVMPEYYIKNQRQINHVNRKITFFTYNIVVKIFP